ncbi:cell division transport system permease protein [Friedmanniella endophytica]|uniref:Cell division protein FtsX n=1 Tax=Microlunatus kandeliicorticis TaxID=1759536 RepID=A0A7W3IUZ7_9ACTN|nr:permease-like cell division protein FtsX [Microlunatus kandeliicorticis]MBA8795754.1 cell division transport system permease protein [Microlunatus kandeliicorticis]
MRLRHIFAEAGAGLRRNLTMTLAVIMTMWVSLSLFGTGILAQQEVNLVKGKWYDKIEITVFLCSKVTQGDNCDPGQDVTTAQKATILQALQSNPEVATVIYESKAEAFAEFQKAYEGNPLQGSLTEDQMQESYRVKLKNPEQYEGVVSAVGGLPGVQTVQDLRKFLDPFFSWVNLLQRGTIIASVLLLAAAALQIGNTIRLAAFARRREIGIMRLVGASNFYITLPFLLESVIASLVGIGLACGTLAAGVYFIVIRKARVSIQSIGWIGWNQAGLSMAFVALVGLLLAVVPTLITTRKYLRV